MAALDRLDKHYQKTGVRVSLFGAVERYCDAVEKAGVNGRSLDEMVTGFLSTVATVKRKELSEAVNDFVAAEELRTKASEGERSQLSAKYHYNRAIMLRRFADSLLGYAICDLGKTHLDAFIGGLAEVKSKSRNGKPVTSAKARNHYRAALRQFLTSWK